MVEITYQMVLSTLQTVGLLVGIFYYITIMRNSQKARRYQFLQSSLETRSKEEDVLKFRYVMSLEWDDYEDYQSKYGYEANPEAYAKIWSYFNQFDDVGLMLRRGLIDIEDMYDLSERTIPLIWKKYQPIFVESRKRVSPTIMIQFQHLVEELHKESIRRGDKLLADLV
jgi:hypothetical protein